MMAALLSSIMASTVGSVECSSQYCFCTSRSAFVPVAAILACGCAVAGAPGLRSTSLDALMNCATVGLPELQRDGQ
jgi:hypothetical protein